MNRILCINPGSTSTKIAVFDDLKPIFEKGLTHSASDLSQFNIINDQIEFRKLSIEDALKENNIELNSLTAIACRGGVIHPLLSGTYVVDEKTCDFFKNPWSDHASNIASIIGKELADQVGIKAYFVDAPCTCEIDDVAKLSGLKEITRRANFHALNQKSIARKFAKDNNKKYEDLNLIIAHIGGGISVGAHKKGVVIDAVDGMSEGSFSPERAGAIPTMNLVDMCYSGEYTVEQIRKMLSGKGGFVSYLGTNDVKSVTEQYDENDEYKKVVDAMAYQISKSISMLGAVLFGKVDAIILTGGVAYSNIVTDLIKERVSYIAPVHVYAGEREMIALAEGVTRVLENKLKPSKVY